MIFSEMLCKVLEITPDLGELEGTCCICKKHTENGFKKQHTNHHTGTVQKQQCVLFQKTKLKRRF